MRAMVLDKLQTVEANGRPLQMQTLDVPAPSSDQVLIQVRYCGVCHTELDEIEGRTPPPSLPCVLGHQAVGEVVAFGDEVTSLEKGSIVGVAWIFSSCGDCEHCLAGNDNLCAEFRATGRDADGGYAEYMVAPADYVFPLPKALKPEQAAPLLCAGAIGYRSLRLANLKDGDRLGMTGFGASAHLMMKMLHALYPNSPVYVFARQPKEQEYARSLGAVWAGNTDDEPPEKLHAIVDTTPAWFPITQAMQALRPGGRLVINAIRKESKDQSVLLDLDYEHHLWMEKEIKSVANVSRRDVREFLDLAAEIHIEPEIRLYDLEEANEALCDMKYSAIRGAKVLCCSS